MGDGGIRGELRKIRRAEPGGRFEETHERHRISNQVVRFSVIALGLLLMVASAVTFWVPGPNFVLVLAGLALVSGQWRAVAKLLDRGEVAARRWNEQTWDPMPLWRKRLVLFVLWLVGATIAAALAWFSYQQGALNWLPWLED